MTRELLIEALNDLRKFIAPTAHYALNDLIHEIEECGVQMIRPRNDRYDDLRRSA